MWYGIQFHEIQTQMLKTHSKMINKRLFISALEQSLLKAKIKNVFKIFFFRILNEWSKIDWLSCKQHNRSDLRPKSTKCVNSTLKLCKVKLSKTIKDGEKKEQLILQLLNQLKLLGQDRIKKQEHVSSFFFLIIFFF